MPDPRSELGDPRTAPERLAELAQQHPELGPLIAAHPNAYPELRAWIAQYAGGGPSPADQGSADPDSGATPAGYGAGYGQAGGYGAPSGGDAPGSGGPAAYGDPRPLSHDPAAGYGAPGSPALAGEVFPEAPRKRRRGLFVVLGIVLVLLLAGGGALWWALAAKPGGSATPEAAATKLLTGAAQLDPLAIYGSLAPSEFDALRPSLDRLASVKPKRADANTTQQIAEVRRAFSITVEDLETETEEIAPGVSRVLLTDGTITIDGDEDEIVDALLGDFTESLADGAENADDREWARQNMRDFLELPFTIELRHYADDYDFVDLGLISVQEGGGWFVSPMMTLTDLQYRYMDENNRIDGFELGDAVVAAKPSESPEAAAEALVDEMVSIKNRSMINTSDLEDVAARLPEAERRAVSIYGPFYFTLPFSPGILLTPITDQLGNEYELVEQSYAAEIDGDRARLSIESLEWRRDREEHGLSLTSSYRLETRKGGLCQASVREYAEDTSDSYYYEEWEVERTEYEGCLGDGDFERALDLDRLSPIAVQEDGGWFVSPLATVAEGADLASASLAEMIERGELGEKMRLDWHYYLFF